MARFTGHEPCPRCGSRNNLARYDDGSAFCFGCKYHERRNASAFNPSDSGKQQSQRPSGRSLTTVYGEPAVQWISSYGISVPELLSRGVKWDSSTSQLIFPFKDKDGEPCCIQARNFSSDRRSKRKCENDGSVYEAFPLYQKESSAHPHWVVITEDPLSAIKVSRQVDAIPCLGTNFPVHKINELHNRGYQHVVAWLDSDKWREGREIADKCKWVGMSATTLLTDLDPKCYTDEQIATYLSLKEAP